MGGLEVLIGLILAATLLAAAARRVGAPWLEHDRSPAAESVRQELTAHLGSVDANPGEGETKRSAHHDLHDRALQAARQAVLDMRTREEIGDDAFHQMEEEFGLDRNVWRQERRR